MFHRALLFAQLVVVTVLAALHIYALANYSYWVFPWLDIVSHLLGGILAGLFSFWIAAKFGKAPNMLFCIAVVLALGISWELFEALNGITNIASEMLDTLGDISMDILGGISGVYAARLISRSLP